MYTATKSTIYILMTINKANGFHSIGKCSFLRFLSSIQLAHNQDYNTNLAE